MCEADKEWCSILKPTTKKKKNICRLPGVSLGRQCPKQLKWMSGSGLVCRSDLNDFCAVIWSCVVDKSITYLWIFSVYKWCKPQTKAFKNLPHMVESHKRHVGNKQLHVSGLYNLVFHPVSE